MYILYKYILGYNVIHNIFRLHDISPLYLMQPTFEATPLWYLEHYGCTLSYRAMSFFFARRINWSSQVLKKHEDKVFSTTTGGMYVVCICIWNVYVMYMVCISLRALFSPAVVWQIIHPLCTLGVFVSRETQLDGRHLGASRIIFFCDWIFCDDWIRNDLWCVCM